MDELLAEYLGIHFGDGHLSLAQNHNHSICVCLNLKEKQYALFVRALFLRLFKKELAYKENPQKHLIMLRAYSKKTWQSLHEMGAPIGRKNLLRIPKDVMDDKMLIAAFLRGLFDTDGCTTTQRDRGYAYPLVKIAMKDKGFARDVQKAFLHLDISSYICKKSGRQQEGFDVVIRRKASLQRFNTLIGTRKKSGGAAIRTRIPRSLP